MNEVQYNSDNGLLATSQQRRGKGSTAEKIDNELRILSDKANGIKPKTETIENSSGVLNWLKNQGEKIINKIQKIISPKKT